MTDPTSKHGIFWRLLNRIAPAPHRGQESAQEPNITIKEYTAQALAEAARIKAIRDIELAKIAAEADYLEQKNKLSARLESLVPKRGGVFHKIITSSPTDSKGKKQSNSLIAVVWRRVPLKPVIIPLLITMVALLIYARAC